MSTAPNTDIYFCNVPWDSSYKHVSDGADSTYITGTAIKIVTDYTYQRKDNVIKVAAGIDELITANYVAYKNVNHENKWIYAFIEKLEYIGENSTAVYIKTDVFQTWRGQMTLKQCFVEREHVADDTVGLNTVPESLETGDFVFHASGSTGYNRAFMGDLGIIIAVTEYTNDDGTTWLTAPGNTYGGVFSGCKLYGSTSPGNVAAFLSNYVTGGKTDSVVAVYMIPSVFLDSWNSAVTALPGSSLCKTISINAPARPTTIQGYTPKNNKLLTFPYVHLTVDNNGGGAATFKYEDFQSAPAFSIYGGVMPNPVYKCFPANLNNSNGAGNGLEYGLTITGYPVCAWSSDSFKNWLAQNALPIAGTVAGSVGAIVGGVATANPLMIAGGIGGVLSQAQALYQRSLIPDQMNGSLNAGNANNGKEWNDFYFHVKTIKAEYARIIDEFFSMFGYKINRVKTPATTGRAQWNYVKTIDCLITGAIPAEDKAELENIFNKGVTVWHTPANIGNYSLANGV